MKHLKTAVSMVVAVLAGLAIILLVPFILIFRLINRFFVAKPGYTDIYAPYYSQLNPYGGPDGWAQSKTGVPPEALTLYAVHQAYEGISAGGFSKFFDSGTGILAPEARDGFKAIGMDDVAELIQSAMDRLGNPFPTDRAERQAIVNIDDALLKFEETEKFKALTGNPKKFGGAPKYYAFAETYAAQHRD